ncbi:hypothetical protein [Kaarinaea lacus]
MKKLSQAMCKILGLILTVLVITSCAGNASKKRADEIGDPSVPSPELRQHFLTIRDAFNRHDTNFDGFLDVHEFAQFQTDPNIVTMRSKIPELADSGPMLFEEIDENGDGLISDNEIQVIAQPLLPRKR